MPPLPDPPRLPTRTPTERTLLRLGLVSLLLLLPLLGACSPGPADPAAPPTPGQVSAPAPPTAPPAAAPAIAPVGPPPTPSARSQPAAETAETQGPRSRAVDEAVKDHAEALSRPVGHLSDLERALKTPLAESRVGFVNAHQLLESEAGEPSHFSYALNPLYNESSDGRERFLIFGNSPNFLNYRAGDLASILRQNSDRAIWSVNNNIRVTTVIQVDNDLSDDLLRHIVESRARAGFRIFVVGNEFNDPGAAWRYNFPRLLRALQVTRSTLSSLGITNATVYAPSLAYFESDKHLDAFLTYVKQNTRQFPADGITQHLYGSVDSVVQNLESLESVLEKHKLEQLRLRIGELGSPVDTYHQPFPDEQLAYNFFPQTIALALSHDLVDSVDVFSVFEFGRDKFSLSYQDGQVLRPKASLIAARHAARVFARVKDVDYERDGDIHRVVVERADDRKLWIVWSSAEGRDVSLKRPDDADVYGALGNRLDEDTIVLTPRPHQALAGTAKYVLFED